MKCGIKGERTCPKGYDLEHGYCCAECGDVGSCAYACFFANNVRVNDIVCRYAEDHGRNVVHPEHYNVGSIEVWDAITDWKLDFVLGNVVKYVARAGHKMDKLEDLLKAKEYIEKAIENEQRKQTET